jgi:hypothetical protein
MVRSFRLLTGVGVGGLLGVVMLVACGSEDRAPQASSPDASAASDGSAGEASTASGDGGKKNAGPDVLRQAFLTSTTGSANLSTWPGAQGKAGLEAADAICQTHAVAAGLSGTFAAWLSTDQDDAYCRVQKLRGKKATACGQSAVPKMAGPWVRTDGIPWAGRIEQLTEAQNLHVYSPLLLDEHGAPAQHTGFFSNTTASGEYDVQQDASCDGWTNGSDRSTVGVGSGAVTGAGWTRPGGGEPECATPQSLACLETEPGPPLSFPGVSGKVVFVTTGVGTGNIASWAESGGVAGIAGADAVCRAQALATARPNAPAYKAWLSAGASKAIDRILSNGPWVRADGMKLADTKAELESGLLQTALNVTGSGAYLSSGGAWVGKTGANCQDWQSAAIETKGQSGSIQGVSTLQGQASSACILSMRLICVED